jgi:YD repeat-containing protein
VAYPFRFWCFGKGWVRSSGFDCCCGWSLFFAKHGPHAFFRQFLAALLSFTVAFPTLARPTITQTDANNHATSYAYDQRGRRLQRKLPLA